VSEPLPPNPPTRGVLNVHTIVASVLVAALMGASYPYIVLKLGFGPNLSVVAAFFGFVFLSLFNLMLGRKRRAHCLYRRPQHDGRSAG
jgi:membrane associated rhomboid family serine protease